MNRRFAAACWNPASHLAAERATANVDRRRRAAVQWKFTPLSHEPRSRGAACILAFVRSLVRPPPHSVLLILTRAMDPLIVGLVRYDAGRRGAPP